MERFVTYQNGNYQVMLDTYTGTKIRENDLDFFKAAFPESMDLKITNRCHNNCAFCHEGSTCNGKHGDILSESFIDRLHPYTEIAIGGGNPLEHPDLEEFLKKCKELKLVPSMTIRQNDFMSNLTFLQKLRDNKLIYGLGISLAAVPDSSFISAVQTFPNAVIHVINGLVSLTDLEKLANNNLKILILGYKEVRKGRNLYQSDTMRKSIDTKKAELYSKLQEILVNNWFNVVSFDNLAIKQLAPQRLVSKEAWDTMFMGDDYANGELTSASMYVDMVERTFAANSCISEIENYPLIENIVDMYSFLIKRSKEAYE